MNCDPAPSGSTPPSQGCCAEAEATVGTTRASPVNGADGRPPPGAIHEFVAAHNPEALLADGFGEAFLGVVVCKGRDPVALYDLARCVDILVGQGLSLEDAEEYLSFNVLDAFVGAGTPAFLVRPDATS